jgi:hypothetical protein
MGRQVVLTVKNKHYNKRRIDNEIQNIKRMLQHIESFQAFCDNNEVLDISKRRVIKNYRRLHNMYCHGTDASTFIFVCSKN